MSSSLSRLLPGVPLIENPFFDQIFTEGAFEPEILRLAHALHRDGYAVLDFPDADFPARAERIRSNLHDRYDWAGWKEGRISSLRVQDAWASDEDVKSIALNPRIMELLSTLYGRQALPLQTLDFPVGTQQPVHSDSAHFSCYPERFMCGVWVALEDIGPDQGPLVYFPGSHRWPIYTNEHLGVNSSFVASRREHYEDLRKVWDGLIAAHGIAPQRFFARKGQALIWMANLLHGGDQQNDLSLSRWSQVTHYVFENSCYFDPLASDPFYGKIAFREVRDIRTGQIVKHRVGGQPVAEDFVKAVAPKPSSHARLVDGKVVLPDDFDAAGYLRLNPDVAAARIDPRQHYIEFGAKEGRSWR